MTPSPTLRRRSVRGAAIALAAAGALTATAGPAGAETPSPLGSIRNGSVGWVPTSPDQVLYSVGLIVGTPVVVGSMISCAIESGITGQNADRCM